MSKEVIKPCPSCGEKEIELGGSIDTRGEIYWRECPSCYMTGPEAEWPKGSLKGWNALLRQEEVYRELVDLLNRGDSYVETILKLDELAFNYKPQPTKEKTNE